MLDADVVLVRNDELAEDLPWSRDEMHMPFALAPLAADFVRGCGVGFRGWPRQYSGGEFGDFAPSAYYAVRDGYAYVADVHGPGDEEPEAFRARKTALCRARALATASYWRDQLQPELTSLFERIDRAAFPSGSTGAGAAWDAAWVAFERVEEIHFDITLGPIQAMNDLAAAYQAAIPGSQVMDADWLIMGRRHELVEVELVVEELTSRVTASPQLGAALASGIRSSEALADLDGGTGFIALLAAFLARHGHLGQSADDLSLASWGEAPASLLTEISRRAIHPPEPVLGRVERQGREAAERADTIRAALEDKPADLARFEELLALARDIGGLTETHNYWIDRRAQASMRTLALRAGSRLTEAGVIDDASDVLYLHRDEVAALLDRRADRRSLVAARRVEHERQRRTRPPQTLGRPAADAAGDGDAPGGVAVPTAEERPSADPLLLHGSASSPGVVRGPARVVLTSDDFDRVRAGDIIVCPSSNPSWVIVFMVAGGLVTNTGDVLCHAAVVARELEIPAVTGVGDATSLIDDGTLLELDGTAGTVRILPNGMATAAPES